MATTTLTDVTNQIQKYWAPVFTKQLRSTLPLVGLVDKSYDGQIRAQGDTVYVSQINAPTGQLLTVGTDADTFSSEAVSTTRVQIQANKRAVASFKFQDLVSLQSQISPENSEVMDSLRYAMANQINSYIYSLISPSTSSPDHDISGVSDLNAAQVAALRVLAGQAKWSMDKPWYLLADPQYHGDIMAAAQLSSSDYVGGDVPTVNGFVGSKRYGFTVIEDNSMSADHAVVFHPDFLHMVSQTQVQVKISDLHALGQFGVVMSVDMVFGASLGVDGNKKHMKVYNSSW